MVVGCGKIFVGRKLLVFGRRELAWRRRGSPFIVEIGADVLWQTDVAEQQQTCCSQRFTAANCLDGQHSPFQGIIFSFGIIQQILE
jgi:hypothetical protein